MTAPDFAALAKAALPCEMAGSIRGDLPPFGDHFAGFRPPMRECAVEGTKYLCPTCAKHPAVEKALREAYAAGKRAAFEEAVNVARRHISDASKITASYGRAVYESCECVKDDLTALLADAEKEAKT